MNPMTLCIPSSTPALEYAAGILRNSGVTITSSPDDADCLLYPIPTPPAIMADYTCGKAVIGGNLNFLCPCINCMDLLKDPYYLAVNAAITAEAALGLILTNLSCAITDAEILILGWGRIGKCLTHQLKALDTNLSVYTRNPKDLAMLRALSYKPVNREELTQQLPKFHCIVNTVPAQVLTPEESETIRPDCFKLELASMLYLPGDGVLHAKGLPGKCKPKASGELIAKTILYHLKEV